MNPFGVMTARATPSFGIAAHGTRGAVVAVVVVVSATVVVVVVVFVVSAAGLALDEHAASAITSPSVMRRWGLRAWRRSRP
jgi:chromate transport protein ChrA